MDALDEKLEEILVWVRPDRHKLAAYTAPSAIPEAAKRFKEEYHSAECISNYYEKRKEKGLSIDQDKYTKDMLDLITLPHTGGTQ